MRFGGVQQFQNQNLAQQDNLAGLSLLLDTRDQHTNHPAAALEQQMLPHRKLLLEPWVVQPTLKFSKILAMHLNYTDNDRS